MSASLILNRWLNRLYKTLAILLVLFAVFISALRLLLPYAHHYRQDFQDYINTTYQSNVIVGALTMGWQKDGPILVAKNVSLLHLDSAEVFIENIDLHVDFWRSIKNRRLITKDFTLDGAKVLIDRTQFTQGAMTEQDASLVESISDLFLSQIGRFRVQDSQVIFQTDAKQQVVLVEQLSWLNIDDRHRAKGDVIFDGLTSNNVKLLMDVKGQSLAEMNGQVYLQANNINITPWLDRILAIEDDKTDSNINFDAWLNIENGSAKQFQLAYGNNDITWQYQGRETVVELNDGQVLVNNIDNIDFTSVETSPLTFSVNNNQWQPISIYANKQHSISSLYIDKLDLASIKDFAPLFVEDQQLLTSLDELAPKGQLFDVFVKGTGKNSQIVADFSDIAINYSQGIPGISNVSGQLVYANDQVLVNANAKQGALDFNKHFIRPLPYNKLVTQFDIRLSDSGWQLNVPQLSLESDELSFNGTVSLNKQDNTPLEMALLATLNNVDAANAKYYYPHLLMGENLVSYLNQSLISGKVSQAQVMINGPLSSFPFKNNSGIFVVDAELTESEFQFDPHWPAITNFNANLNFTNNGMLITAREGSLAGVDVTGVKAEIEDLANQQILQIDTKIHKTAPQIVAGLMNQSPLQSSVGEVLNQLSISKDIDGELALTIPLNDIDNIVAKGKVHFRDNQIELASPEMIFTEVNGQLDFRNEVISVNKLSLNWRDMPLNLVVKGSDSKDYYTTNIDMSARWQEELWQLQVPELLTSYAKGELAWQGELTLFNHKGGGFSYQLDLESELYDLAVNLPEPYLKSEFENYPLSINVSGQLSQSTINATLGEHATFYGVLAHQPTTFSRAHLVLGKETMLLPTDGFHISTNLPKTDFSKWQPFISDIITSVEQQRNDEQLEHYLIASPERIRGTIGELDLFGYTLNDVSFNLLDKKAWWLLQLNAKEARSQVKFYPEWLTQGIDIDADFIRFASESEQLTEPAQVETEQSAASDDINDKEVFVNIPPMRVSCDSCQFGNLDLGKVDFEILRSSSELVELSRFTAKRGKTALNIDGYWLHDENGSKTQLKGEYTAKDIEREIEKLGYASIIKDSGVKASFDVDWLGGPYDFTTESFNGQISGALDDGYLADVSDKGTRIFSVLSLQSLVRKLTLDFRDIFSDGMFYSSIKGDFDIKDGVLYTKNTKMNGAAGDLTIKGNTDLSKGELDYRMSYRPDLTSSLPVLAWIAGTNPAIALAGIALDEIFISKVVSELNFELTGNLDEPNLREVDRKSKDISVGRSSPPQIVDNNSATTETKPLKPEDPLPEEKQNQLPGNKDG